MKRNSNRGKKAEFRNTRANSGKHFVKVDYTDTRGLVVWNLKGEEGKSITGSKLVGSKMGAFKLFGYLRGCMFKGGFDAAKVGEFS